MHTVSTKSYNKYTRVNRLDIFNNLRKFHQYIKSNYLNKYFIGGTIIDVGSSNLKSLKFWINLQNVRHIYSLEPSEELYNIGFKTCMRNQFSKKNVTFIRATGEDNWSDGSAAFNTSSENKLINMKNNKADLITFEFSFHYLVYNIDMVINNIKNFSKSGTKIIIHTLNGDLIKERLRDQEKFIVYRDDEEVFYLQKLYNNEDQLKKINVYFKGVTGLDNIISEDIVEQDYLYEKFSNDSFDLTEYSEFPDNFNDDYVLEQHERDISSLYVTYVFTLK